jgi:hypothetical protein
MIRGFVACYLIFDEPANSGWWFQTFVIVHFICGIIPTPLTDFHIFSKRFKPPTRLLSTIINHIITYNNL